jgi:hypothetical protein
MLFRIVLLQAFCIHQAANDTSTMENDPTMSTANSLLSAAVMTTSNTGLRESQKRRCEEKQHKRFQKKMKEAQLRVVATELAAEKKNNAGRLPHKALIKAIAALASVGVQTTKSVLQKQMKKTLDQEECQPWAAPAPAASIVVASDEDNQQIVPVPEVKKKGRPPGTMTPMRLLDCSSRSVRSMAMVPTCGTDF